MRVWEVYYTAYGSEAQWGYLFATEERAKKELERLRSLVEKEDKVYGEWDCWAREVEEV